MSEPATANPSRAALDIIRERFRQIAEEGWSATHDDAERRGEIARAAACYALGCATVGPSRGGIWLWPWAKEWWKPKDRRRDLVRAGALILAEIERLDRAAEKSA